MYAIARIAGKQFRIEPETKFKVPTLPLAIGSTYEIPEILFATDGEKRYVGQPTVGEVKITAKVLLHGRDPKVMVFRMKRRKGFRSLRGHRQGYTLLQIDSVSGLTVKPKEKVEPKKKAKTKVEVPVEPVEAKPKPKKTVAKPKAKKQEKK
jgi:large subunit ribosomal protein L21